MVCWLLFVGVRCCWLLMRFVVVRRVLSFVGCRLLVVDCWLLFVGCCLIVVVCSWLFGVARHCMSVVFFGVVCLLV